MSFEIVNPEEIALTDDEEKRKLAFGDQTEEKRRFNEFRPVGMEKNVLTVRTPPGKVDRWVLDHPPGRITYMLERGYSMVVDETVEVGDKSVDGQRVPGGVVSKYGDPKFKTLTYLMRIDKDRYDALQKEKQDEVDKVHNQLYGNRGDGLYTTKDSKVETGIAIHGKR